MPSNLSLLMQALIASGVSTPAVTPVLTVASTTGVAPFGIVVDGIQTTTTNGSIRKERDLIYFFQCSDTGMGNYTNGVLAGKARNQFVGGPVAAFTLVTPGTQTISMWAYDGTTVYGPSTQTITVQDPDVVFPTTNTICVSTSGTFTGAPTGATQVTSSDFSAAINTYKGSGKRILFRSGENFTAATGCTYSTLTEFYVGTFGGSPRATVTATANGLILLSGFTSTAANNNDKIRVVNLEFTRVLAGGVTGGIALGTGNKPVTTGQIDYNKGNFTFHNCKASNIMALSTATGGYNTVFSQCVTTNLNEGVAQTGYCSIWIDEMVRGAVIDSNLDNNIGCEHVIRRQGGSYCTFISNYLARASASKSFLTLRGWQGRNAGTQITSQYNQMSYNYIDGSLSTGTQPFLALDVAPQNGSVWEPIADTIVEGNYVYAHNVGAAYSNLCRVQAIRVTYRNNMHYFPAGMTNSFQGMQISGPSTNTAGCSDSDFLFNSYHAASTSTGFSAFTKGSGAGADTRVYGTIAYAPNCTKDGNGAGGTPTLYVDASGAFTQADNSSNTQIKSTDPLFVGPTTTYAGLKLQSGSYAKNMVSTNYLVRTDGLNYLRSGSTFDAGALNAPDKQTDAWTVVMNAPAALAGLTLSLSVTADSGVASTTTCSGVAPFGVVFDLTASTALAGSAFHDYIYFYDFGDGTAQTYTYGQLVGQTKNRYVGAPLMAYVYETPGTYTPRVWASNGVSTVGPVTATITVDDPDSLSVYSWANTYFIAQSYAPSPGDGFVPAGATPGNCHQYTDFTTSILPLIGTGKRIRLFAGDTFTASGSGVKANVQNVTLDTFGGTAYARINSTVTVPTLVPILQPFPNSTPNNPDKWRVRKIHFSRDTTNDCTFTGSISGTVLTVSAVTAGAITTGQRLHWSSMPSSPAVTISSFGTGTGGVGTYNLSSSQSGSGAMATVTTQTMGFTYGINAETSGTRDYQKGRLTMHDCKFSYITSSGVYSSGYGTVISKTVVDYMASGAAYLSGAVGAYLTNGVLGGLIDCLIDNKDSGEHSIRVQGYDKLVVVSNEAARPSTTKSFITVRGWTFLTDQTISMRYGNVAYNYINGTLSTQAGSWPSQLSPQNNGSQENIKDVVWEKNFYYLPTSCTLGLYVTARDVSVRNNTIYSLGNTYFSAFWTVYTNTASTLTPSGVNYYDNTVYAPNVPGFSLLQTDTSTLSTMSGCIGYAPSATKDGANVLAGPSVVTVASSGATYTLGTNSTDSQIKSTNPLWAGPATTQAGYALQSGSYAKNAGVDLLVRTDGVNKLRNGGAFDLGAMNAPDKQVDAWTLIP